MATLTISPEEEKRVKGLGFLSNKGTDNFNCRIITVNGKMTSEQLTAAAEAAKKFGDGNIVFTTRLTVELQGVPFDKIDELREFLSQHGMTTGGTGSRVRPVVACKGTTCQYGLLDSYGLSEKIHERFYVGYHDVLLPHKFKIAVGGCPNNCVKPNLNDLGIIGQRIPDFDEDECNGCKKCSVVAACPIKACKVEDGLLEISDRCNHCGRCIGKCRFDAITDGKYGYKICLGGRWGKEVKMGQAMSKIFTSEEEVLNIIEKALLLFREQGKTGERFASTIDRLGFDRVEELLLSDELLERKQEILDADLHMKGGATC